MSEQHFVINRDKIDRYVHSDKALFHQVFADLVRAEIIEMIDPCEHGNYARHFTGETVVNGTVIKWKWCPGTAVKGET